MSRALPASRGELGELVVAAGLADQAPGAGAAFGEDLEQQLGAALVDFHVAQLVNAEQVDAAVAGDGLGELPVIGGLHELVHQLGGQGVADLAD